MNAGFYGPGQMQVYGPATSLVWRTKAGSGTMAVILLRNRDHAEIPVLSSLLIRGRIRMPEFANKKKLFMEFR
jgi:hypothetical protein